MVSLVLFKNNLRFNDNDVLYEACLNDSKILPVFIYDEINTNKKLGSSSKYWLYHSLNSLNKKLDNNLQFFKADTLKIINDLSNLYNVDNIFCEEPFLEQDISLFEKLSVLCKEKNIRLHAKNCTLLWRPYHILKSDDTPYKVFTPFYRKGCLNSDSPKKPVGSPRNINYLNCDNSTLLSQLNLLDKFPWYDKFDNLWTINEDFAIEEFKSFIKTKIDDYKSERDFPALEKNSKLSPYIRFGLISINRMWHELNQIIPNKSIEHYKSELGWREFSYYLLYHFPHLESKNMQPKFDNFKWENSNKYFNAWKKGQTGYPIVDAGMRELWQTGFIHNRTRMVVASFLVKNLLIDWRLGEKWFWDCLVDADYASNVASWQWVAGTGADAAPYFRIFNPILQGKKFDTEGKYIRKYIPELNSISDKFLNEPWETTHDLDYPDPIINYSYSRQRALEKYEQIK
tara:strand:+ start:9093 stop:10463 length:1371 start_codon:yes stop_codon:yes gene_type:complete